MLKKDDPDKQLCIIRFIRLMSMLIMNVVSPK